MPVSSWSTVAASNNASPPNGAPEGMAPSAVNDTIRQIMADVRTFYDSATSIVQNAQTGNYTLVLADASAHIYHASGGTSGITYTIPANASVAFPTGTVVSFVNQHATAISIAITTDTMTLAGTTTTGTRTLAQNGIATALKVSSTTWLIYGVGLS
jgi:hypothetical protein